MNMQERKRPPLVLRELFIIGFCSIGLFATLLKLPHPSLFCLTGVLLGNLATLIWPDLFGVPEFRPVLIGMFRLLRRPRSAGK